MTGSKDAVIPRSGVIATDFVVAHRNIGTRLLRQGPSTVTVAGRESQCRRLGILLSSCGECDDPKECPADLNGDGVVDGADLGILLQAWTMRWSHRAASDRDQFDRMAGIGDATWTKPLAIGL